MGFIASQIIGYLASSLVGDTFSRGKKGSKPDINQPYQRLNDELHGNIVDLEPLPYDASKPKEEFDSELTSSFMRFNRDEVSDLYSALEESSKKSVEAVYEVKRDINDKISTLNENIESVNENIKSSIEATTTYGSTQMEAMGQIANPKGPLSFLGNAGSSLLSAVTSIAGALGLLGYGAFKVAGNLLNKGKGPDVPFTDDVNEDFANVEEGLSEEGRALDAQKSDIETSISEKEETMGSFKDEFGVDASYVATNIKDAGDGVGSANYATSTQMQAARHLMEEGTSDEERKFLEEQGFTPSQDPLINIMYLLSLFKDYDKNRSGLRKVGDKADLALHGSEEYQKQLAQLFEEGMRAYWESQDLKEQLKEVKNDIFYNEQYHDDLLEIKAQASALQVAGNMAEKGYTTGLFDESFMEGSNYQKVFGTKMGELNDLAQDVLSIREGDTEKALEAKRRLTEDKEFIDNMLADIDELGIVEIIQNAISPSRMKEFNDKYHLIGDNGEYIPTEGDGDEEYNKILYLKYALDNQKELSNDKRGSAGYYYNEIMSGNLGMAIDNETGQFIDYSNPDQLVPLINELVDTMGFTDKYTFTSPTHEGPDTTFIGGDIVASPDVVKEAVSNTYPEIADKLDAMSLSAYDSQQMMTWLFSNQNASTKAILDTLEYLVNTPDSPTVILPASSTSTDGL